jgi:two-component system CheB/CheR fusion protein
MRRGASIERRVTAQDGALHYLMRVFPYELSDSAASALLLTFVDITNVIRAEEYEKILVAEINHRVKNTLSVVMSIATNTFKRSTTLEGFSTGLMGRLQALAHTHDVLSRTNWANTPLRALIEGEIAPYAADEDKSVALDGPNLSLVPKAALAMGMAIHELATNAAKYGALSVPIGKVRVRWSIQGKAAEKNLIIEWIETGGPSVENARGHKGFGMELLERGLKFELGGETKLQFLPKGLHCLIQIPMSPNVAPPPVKG